MHPKALLSSLLLLLLPYAALGQASAPWQQRVQYDMDISLLADRHEMEGHQRLRYFNNSPDTLRTVFYHLYFNAFQPGSMMAERNRELPDPDSRVVPRIFNLGPDEIGYHRINSLTQNGEPVGYEINDTVMRVDLNEPIPPGGSAVFEMQFYSQVPLQTRRSGRDNREGIDFSMTQWYPKVAQYDERGWHADPYVGREFYAPFGTFDVHITLPADYTIGATGTLENAGEVGHGYEGTGQTRYRPEDARPEGDSLTWRFTAENVHDFAWAADPDYIHDRFESEGVTYHLLYQPSVEQIWQPMQQWVPQIIEFYSDQYGPYAYPQFTVAQGGDGGMEYPMMTLITGERPPRSLLGVTAHEAAHEWFYAALATNEADYAWMDEGFTSYATTEVMAHITGQPASHTGSRLNVLYLQDLGLYERVNTPADWFETNTAYGIASYTAGEMFVDMLGYVISEELRDEWIREYYRRFRFRHPNPYDLEKIAEDVSGLRLDWYFEQFLNTTRSLDYAVEDLDAEQRGGSWQTEIVLERESEIVMPVDLQLTYADGTTQWVTIPLGVMEGHKPVPADWIVAEPWLWTFPEYTFTAELPKRVVSAEIDPTGAMPDKNRLNNTSGFPLEADFLEAPGQDWFNYRLGYRPLLQYARHFGVGAGMQARGQYLFGKHRLKAMLKLWPQVLFTGGDQPDLDLEDSVWDAYCDVTPEYHNCSIDTSPFDGVDYELTYERGVPGLGTEADVSLSARKHLGILENTVSVVKPLGTYFSNTNHELSASVIHQFTPSERVFPADGSYSLLPTRIGYPTLFNDHHIVSARLGYAASGEVGFVNAFVEIGGGIDWLDRNPRRRLNASRVSLHAGRTVPIGPFEAEAAFQAGLGADQLAPHKRFRLGAASFEERWRHAAFRSVAAVFDAPRQNAHLVAFDAPGPVAYLLSDFDTSAFFGVGGLPPARNILQGRIDLTTGALFSNRWLRPLQAEAFTGFGTVWNTDDAFFSGTDDAVGSFDQPVADAGVGLSYDVSALSPLQRWVDQSDVLSGLQLRARFPFWASKPELIENGQDPLAFRWLLGIETGL